MRTEPNYAYERGLGPVSGRETAISLSVSQLASFSLCQASTWGSLPSTGAQCVLHAEIMREYLLFQLELFGCLERAAKVGK